MCGIAALIGMSNPVDWTVLCATATTACHRGPEDGGAVLFSDDWRVHAGSVDEPSEFARSDVRAALAHWCLAIVHLSDAGHHPMGRSDGRYWIVFNGEGYNHIALREDLISLDHVFHKATDTEVLLEAYSQWGEQCLDRLNGMFALVLVDRLVKRVFAARDSCGAQPLYWWRSPAGFVAFASEIKQFTVPAGWGARLNGPRARDFLAWNILDQTPVTLFTAHAVRERQQTAADHSGRLPERPGRERGQPRARQPDRIAATRARGAGTAQLHRRRIRHDRACRATIERGVFLPERMRAQPCQGHRCPASGLRPLARSCPPHLRRAKRGVALLTAHGEKPRGRRPDALAGRLAARSGIRRLSGSRRVRATQQGKTFGMTPIEALANRKPLVATRCGGPDDIVHAGNGLLVPVDDVQALAAAMEQMRNAYRSFDPGALRADALSRFGVASVACRFESWYRGLLDGRQMIVNR